MAGPTVRLESDRRGVATITLARPERRNAFDDALIAELTATLGRLQPETRAVVLRGEGDAFCAGADLTWMSGQVDKTLAENLADARGLAELFRSLDELPMPLLARVQGPAIGGGAGLVAVTDIAIASTAAILAFAETRVGILPSVVSPYVVRRLGVVRATAAFVTGRRYDARAAKEIGLVDEAVEPAELDATVDAYVEGILACGPIAAREAKRLVRDVAGRAPSAVRELTIQRIAAIRVSPEGQEGMRAFLEKRAPEWTAKATKG